MCTSQIPIILNDAGEWRTVKLPARLQKVDGDLEVGDLMSLNWGWVMAGHDGAGHRQITKSFNIATGDSQRAQLSPLDAGNQWWRIRLS